MTFSPNTATPHFRKVPLLIDGAPPLWLSLAGSAFDEKTKPAKINLDQMQMDLSSRVEKTEFETRQELFFRGDIIKSGNFLHFAEESSEPNERRPMAELFEEDTAKIPAISLSTNQISFGRCLPDGTVNAVPIQGQN